MNPVYAGTIPIGDILDKMGLKAVKETDTCSCYTSPFDSHSVLEVDRSTNAWHDRSKGQSGGPMELVKGWLNHQGMQCSEVDTLHWLRFNIGYPSMVSLFGMRETTPVTNYEVIGRAVLQDRSLFRYAMRQGLTHVQARKLFKQVLVRNVNTGTEFPALGYRNEDGGFAIYNLQMTGSTPPAAVSYIEGRKRRPEGINVFQTIFDYCAALRSRGGKPFPEHSIILNAHACADDAATYIRAQDYRNLTAWLDDSELSRRAAKAFAWLCSTEPDLKFREP